MLILTFQSEFNTKEVIKENLYCTVLKKLKNRVWWRVKHVGMLRGECYGLLHDRLVYPENCNFSCSLSNIPTVLEMADVWKIKNMRLTHRCVYITTRSNTQNIDVPKNSLLKRQNSIKTVLISFIIVTVWEWRGTLFHAQVCLLAIYRWVTEFHVMGAVLPTAAGRAPNSSDFNSTLKRGRKLWNWKMWNNRRKWALSVVMVIIIMDCGKKSSIFQIVKV
jgi:hypothetical protein